VEDSDDRGVASGEDAGDAAGAASIAARKLFIYKDQVSLHGSVYLVRRNKDVPLRLRRESVFVLFYLVLKRTFVVFYAHETKAIAM
jgi:hypothetical protein